MGRNGSAGQGPGGNGSSGSILRIGSSGSILSIGSAGSVLSIGSAGSILSIGSVGSLLSVASAASVGSVLSAASRWSVRAYRSGKPVPSPLHHAHAGNGAGRSGIGRNGAGRAAPWGPRRSGHAMRVLLAHVRPNSAAEGPRQLQV